jgi:hypothetical protein
MAAFALGKVGHFLEHPFPILDPLRVRGGAFLGLLLSLLGLHSFTYKYLWGRFGILLWGLFRTILGPVIIYSERAQMQIYSAPRKTRPVTTAKKVARMALLIPRKTNCLPVPGSMHRWIHFFSFFISGRGVHHKCAG